MLTDLDQDLLSPASKFDWIVQGRPSPAVRDYDKVLLENEQFVAVATLGSIVPGWVLIVPREKAINLAVAHSRRHTAFDDLRRQVRSVLSTSFSHNIYEFEHGPRAPNGPLGCGVEQAHLHVAALPFNLLDEVARVSESARSVIVDGRSPWDAIEPDTDYWLARDPVKDKSTIVYPREPTSQGIRKIIAAKVGRASAWDYRVDPFPDHVLETQRAFQGRGAT